MPASLGQTEILYPNGKVKAINIEGIFPPSVSDELDGEHILFISMNKDISGELCASFVLKNEDGKELRGITIPIHPMLSYAWQREIKATGGEITDPGLDPLTGMQTLSKKLKDLVDYGPMIGYIHGVLSTWVGLHYDITAKPDPSRIKPELVIPILTSGDK